MFTPGEFDATVQRLLKSYRDDDWDVERLFAALLSLIASTPSSAEEESGLALLPWLRANTATLPNAGRHAMALDWLTATLQLDTGVNGFRRSDYAAGIDGYSHALAAFLALGLSRSANDCLKRTVDLIERGEGGANVAVAAITGISRSALTAERIIGAWGGGLDPPGCEPHPGNPDRDSRGPGRPVRVPDLQGSALCDRPIRRLALQESGMRTRTDDAYSVRWRRSRIPKARRGRLSMRTCSCASCQDDVGLRARTSRRFRRRSSGEPGCAVATTPTSGTRCCAMPRNRRRSRFS